MWLVDTPLSRWEVLAVAGTLLGMFAVLAYLLPREVAVVLIAIGSMATVYYSASIAITHNSHRLPDWARTVPIWLTSLLPFAVTTVLAMRYWAFVSPLKVALAIALLTVFFYYWFVVPLALYQKIGEQRRSVSIAEWPAVSVLVPAYDEEGYVGPCIDALLDTGYPSDELDVIVIDDGSADGTLAGYKQFLDGVLIKSLVDVLYGGDLRWTSPRRRRQWDGLVESAASEERATND